MIFEGRNRVRYGYSRFGYTRGGGSTWHGGLDIEGLDSSIIRMPWYKGYKEITGTVTRARIVTDHSNPTWEWGYYVCVQLDAGQTPDTVNFLYFCHNRQNLVKVGQKVRSGDALAIMGNTGNAALASPPFDHCHFEARATATGKGLDPTAYAGIPNETGTYGTELEAPVCTPARLQTITIGPVTQGDADAILAVCKERGLDKQGLYKSKWSNDEHTLQTITIGPVTQGDADAILAVCKARGLDKLGLYSSKWVDEEEETA